MKFEGLDIELVFMGVFGKVECKFKEWVLEVGERVEIYCGLIVDLKEVCKKCVVEKVVKEKVFD